MTTNERFKSILVAREAPFYHLIFASRRPVVSLFDHSPYDLDPGQ
jgi:hypothetical protein